MKSRFNRWASVIVPLLVFFLPVLFCLDMQDTFDLPKLSLGYASVILLTLLWIIQGAQDGKLVWYSTPLDVPLLAFILLTLLAAFHSIEPSLSFFGMYRLYVFGFYPLLSCALLYWLVVQVRSPTLVRRVKIAILSSAAAVSLYALLQYFGCELFDRMPQAPGGRIWSSLGNPLYMGALCMMAWPLALQDLWEGSQSAKGPERQLLPILTLGLISTALALSLSRGAWLGAGAALVCMAASWYKQSVDDRMRHVLLILAAMAALLAWGFPAVRSRAQVLISSKESSNAARLEGWKAGLAIWREYPWLGPGPDTFGRGFRPHRSLAYLRNAGTGMSHMQAHNDFLQILSTTGALGLALLLWLWAALAWEVWAFWKRESLQEEAARVHWAFGAGLCAIAVHNQFNFSSISTSLWAAVLAALFMIKRQAPKEPRTWVISVPPVLRRGVTVCSIAASLLLMWPVVQTLLADWLYKASLGLSEGGNDLAALQLDRRAAHLNPRIDVYQTDLANRARTLAQKSPEGAMRKDLLEEAWETVQQITAAHPRDPDAWNNQGVCAMWLTQLEGVHKESEARRSFEEAIALDPVFVDAWANLAKWEHLAGHLDQEKVLWKKVLEIDPSHTMAKRVLGIR